MLAAQRHELLAFLIAGHHGGLPSRTDLVDWLRDKTKANPAQEAMQDISQYLNAVEPTAVLPVPSHLTSMLDTEFFIRMLFSTLVDTDFLDTERHFNFEQAEKRTDTLPLSELWSKFTVNQERLTGKGSAGRVNTFRHEVYEACVHNAALPPGFFRFTVPTGGGKTRSSMAFALQHSLRHGLDRVIIAIPYTVAPILRGGRGLKLLMSA